MRRVLKNGMLVSYYILQIIIFALCFLSFTSTIKLFPWYEPLTMGAFLMLLIVVPIQVFISLIIWIFRRSLLIHNDSNVISAINSGILIFIIFITMSKESLFYPLAIVCAIAECLLTISFIITIIRQLVSISK